jgi:hypothetical protein
MNDKCSKCGAETELHENGNPICVKCAEKIEAAGRRTAEEKVMHCVPADERSIGAHH